ncbi:MAG: LAGLIDADG family homing endonuclease [Candidatus Paceibacterota bacterium]
MSFYRNPILSSDKELQAYVIGLAVGDGNLSKLARATRLRITCDNKYPKLMNRVVASLRLLLPENKVGIVKRPRNCTDVYVYSNHLEKLLGWKGDMGSKFKQNVSTPEWIFGSWRYKAKYLKGLIETDGSVYQDRGYPMVMITTIIRGLAEEIKSLIDSLGFTSHLYEIDSRKNKYSYNKQLEYHIRLSKNVQKFLDLVQPDKS